jgi:hypothetical protein
MTIKKSLENRIRGWLPQEPYRISTRIKVDYENTHQPPIIMPNHNVSAAKVAGVGAILLIIVYGFLFSKTILHPVWGFQIVAWIIAGLALGIISAMMGTKNQLSRLLKDYKVYPNEKDLALQIVPIFLFVISGFLAIVFIPDSSINEFALSFYTLSVSLFVTRPVLFFAFERREKMRLMQSWWGGEIILIPKAPDNSVNGTKINTKNKLAGFHKR